jgi:putative peptide zinc metalloprotease protein
MNPSGKCLVRCSHETDNGFYIYFLIKFVSVPKIPKGDYLQRVSGMQSFVERSLPLRVRPDLRFEPIHYRTRRCWVVRDPVTLRNFHLTEEERFLLQSLDGKRSVDQLQQTYAEHFAPRRMATPQLQAFLHRLHRQGLILAEQAGQGDQLWQRSRRQRIARWQGMAGNLIAIRFRGINPDPWLVHGRGLAALLFHPWTVAVVAMLLAVGLVALILNGSLFWARLPSFDEFLQAHNLVLLVVSVMGVKVLHELGHALACRHFNRSCPEMGILLLFFLPCLYCDVSSSWTISNKWRRIVVSAAGVYVEMILTAICFWLWWYSQPGVLNSLSFNVLLVCGVGTLLLNGNPLMRYDGYYVLADAWEIPNLDGSGRAAWKRAVFGSFLGVQLSRDHVMEPRAEHWAMGYVLLATLYRFGILWGILAVAHEILEPYRLEIGVWALGGVLLGTMSASGLRKVGGTLGDPTLSHRIRWPQFFLMSSLVAGLLVLVATVPLPYRVHAPATLQFADPHPVYVSVPGGIQEAIRPGTLVESGTPLLVLDNPRLRVEVADLYIEKRRFETRLAALEARRGDDDEASRRIPATRQAEADYAERYQQQQQDIERLTLRAPHAGIIIAPPRQVRVSRDIASKAAWEGTPLETRNVGAWLPEGTLACLVGDPSDVVAIAIVPQTEIDLLAVGQRVTLFPISEPGRQVRGEVLEIAQHPVEVAPVNLQAAGEILTSKDAERRKSDPTANRPLVTSYQVRVTLGEPANSLRIGGRLHGRFIVAPQSFATRCLRFFRRTFALG